MISDIDLIDVKAVNKTILETYGVNFSDYAGTSHRRRIEKSANLLHIPTVDVLLEKLKSDKNFYERFCSNLVVKSTEFFRDPSFWRKLRDDVFPKVKNNTTIRIWAAGCASGEELVSLIIALKEEGVYDKAKIIATEINDLTLLSIKETIYDSKDLETAFSNYERFEGKKKFDDYLLPVGDEFKVNPELFEKVSFQKHWLDNPAVPGKFDLILCRNVFIYFNSSMQDRVVENFSNAMMPSGFLAIGVKENLASSRKSSDFVVVSPEENIFRKK